MLTPISVKGWSGTGYIVLDPESGVGAYMIGGGADGGMINFFGENQNLIVLLLGMVAIASVSLPFLEPVHNLFNNKAMKARLVS